MQTASAELESSENLQTVSGESNQFPQQAICQTLSGKCRNHGGMIRIANDQELDVTLGRIAHFQRQIAHLRNMEPILKITEAQCRDFSPRLTECS